MSGRWVLVLVAAALAPRPAVAQVGTTTDIINGTVLQPGGQPLAGAVVEATSVETRITRQHVTDSRGRFRITFPDGGGRYELTARYIGMAPAHISVARRQEDDRVEATIQMELATATLTPVTVTARTGAPSDRVGAGASERSFDPEKLSRLPIDLSDLNAIAGLQPGVIGIAGTDSSATAFSVAGQRPAANAVMLDGVALGTASIPQDALRSVRVVTNAYDVARGQFWGGIVTSTTRGGTNIPQGSFTYIGQDRALSWGEATASPFGQGATQNQVSGGIGGPLVPNRLFVFAALQTRWRSQALPSLTSADALTLARLGVSPDSVAHFLSLASGSGVPMTVSGIPDDRASAATLALLRLDWQVNNVHTLTLRADGSMETQEPVRIGSLALPATGGTRRTRGGGVMVALTSAPGPFVNELRAYAARQRRDATAYLALPAALVEVSSDLPDGIHGLTTLSFGGNNGLPQWNDDRTLEIADELSWLPGTTAHRFKLGLDVIGTRMHDNETPDQLGTFFFPSLAALAAGSPSAYTRTVAPLGQTGIVWNDALYAGDTWRPVPGGVLQLTYGVRLEHVGFGWMPIYNRAVDSLFGVRTDRLPTETHVSPRIGFTWTLDGGGGHAATFLRGGAGDFHGLTPIGLYAAALGAPGLASAEQQVVCVGAAAPRPNWSLYLQDATTIPSACADTSDAVTSTSRPDVTAFEGRYRAPGARRASLALVRRLGGDYWVTIEGGYARGVNQYGLRDRNLSTTPQFTLADEAGRPVYVPLGSIVPATGAVASTASRRDPAFGHVLVLESGLQSVTKQLGVTLTGATRGGRATFRAGYTFTRARDQSSFSCCAASRGFASPTTAGDPNVLDWGTSTLERRHAFVGTVSVAMTRAFELDAIARLTSGVPFTPIAGSDINGDGARNDRAFVFDPATAADTAVAAAMRMLLARAPSSIAGCLRSQLGRIAARNSCTGPWQPSLDLQLNWRPQWPSADRRLTLSLVTINLLGGLDEWLHGVSGLHGWGYAVAPDPVLLAVTGFDPASARFHYTVNGHFGSVASASGGVSVPLQIGLRGRYTLGPGRVRARPATAPSRPRTARAVPSLPTNPVTAILQLRDSLHCTPEQVAALTAIADSVDAQDRATADSMLVMVRAGAQADSATLAGALEPLVAAARERARAALARAREVLTPDQWAKIAGPDE